MNAQGTVNDEASKRRTRRRIWQLPATLALVPLAIAATSAGPGQGALVPAAEASPAVVAVSGQSPFQDQAWGDDDTRQDEKASRKTGEWRAEADLGSLHSSAQGYGAQELWSPA